MQSACWYTAEVAARLLRVKTHRINVLCRTGRVVGARKAADGRWRVPVEWLGPEYSRRTHA